MEASGCSDGSPKSDKSSNCVENLDSLTCPICLDVYHSPRKINCGHVLCKGCLAHYKPFAVPSCPMCRVAFNPNASEKCPELDKILSSNKGACDGCGKKFILSKLKSHRDSCKSLQQSQPQGICAAVKTLIGSPKKSENLPPNRFTFTCPYCGIRNLDQPSLISHCNDNHKGCRAELVCPICAVMPWGDPTMKSTNLISHLNLRHKFTYDTVVDYDLDDDYALREAIEASLRDK